MTTTKATTPIRVNQTSTSKIITGFSLMEPTLAFILVLLAFRLSPPLPYRAYYPRTTTQLLLARILLLELGALCPSSRLAGTGSTPLLV